MNLKSHIIKSVVEYYFFLKERTQIKSFQIQEDIITYFYLSRQTAKFPTNSQTIMLLKTCSAHVRGHHFGAYIP